MADYADLSITSECEEALAEPFRAAVVGLPAAAGLHELDLARAADAAVIAGELHRARQVLDTLMRRLARRAQRQPAAQRR